jgi:AraC-like DNA-binding protein
LIKFQNDGTFADHPYLLGFLLPLPVLHPVMFYGYTLSLTSVKQSDGVYMILGFSPFFVLLLLLVPFFQLGHAAKLEVINNNGEDYEWFGQIQILMILIAGVVYAYLGFVRIRKVETSTGTYYSTIDFSIFTWLRFLTAGLLFIWSLTAFFDEPVIYLGVVLCVISLGIYGINKAPIFVNVSSGLNQIEKEAKNTTPIQKEEKEKERLEEVIQVLEKEKLYTNPDFTLNDLSKRMGLNSAQVSQLIDAFTEGNFYQLINGLRVEEFKRIVAEPDSRKYTINALAFDCGFKSKTTFNKYFKEHTGKTPSEYINS